MSYHPPFPFRYRHIMTMFPTLFRKISLNYERKRLITSDDDFIDIDFLNNNSDRLVIICHGLEGSSDSVYVKGMAKAFQSRKWDVAAYNYRCCSGEMNKQFRVYHAGATDDLHFVIQEILKNTHYKSVALVGFSLGGNLILKYLGENPALVPKVIRSAVALSAPVDLESCSAEIIKRHNFIYNQRFMRKLKVKIRAKREQIEANGIPVDPILNAKLLTDFDELFTAPAHKFEDAVDYWRKNSAKQFLHRIEIPALLINALDDPFLAKEAFPYEIARQNSNFHLSTPKYGGHCGFVQFNNEKEYWSEVESTKFIQQHG